MKKLIKKIPALISSEVSIYIYLFLFLYLVIFPGIGVLVPFLKQFLPTDDIQLILGNYTNVLSALGASIAAGSGVRAHRTLKEYRSKHEQLEAKIDALHQKLDRLSN